MGTSDAVAILMVLFFAFTVMVGLIQSRWPDKVMALGATERSQGSFVSSLSWLRVKMVAAALLGAVVGFLIGQFA